MQASDPSTPLGGGDASPRGEHDAPDSASPTTDQGAPPPAQKKKPYWPGEEDEADGGSGAKMTPPSKKGQGADKVRALAM